MSSLRVCLILIMIFGMLIRHSEARKGDGDQVKERGSLSDDWNK